MHLRLVDRRRRERLQDREPLRVVPLRRIGELAELHVARNARRRGGQASLPLEVLVGRAERFLERVAGQRAAGETLGVVREAILVGGATEQALVAVRDEPTVVHQYL